MEHAEAVAVLIGKGAAAFVGVLLMVLGWRRSKAGRLLMGDDEAPKLSPAEAHEDRHITRGEWHDLRDVVNRLMWKLDEVQRDLARVETATVRDHDRLSTAVVELAQVRKELETMSDHCEHCPPTRRG